MHAGLTRANLSLCQLLQQQLIESPAGCRGPGCRQGVCSMGCGIGVEANLGGLLTHVNRDCHQCPSTAIRARHFHRE